MYQPYSVKLTYCQIIHVLISCLYIPLLEQQVWHTNFYIYAFNWQYQIKIPLPKDELVCDRQMCIPLLFDRVVCDRQLCIPLPYDKTFLWQTDVHLHTIGWTCLWQTDVHLPTIHNMVFFVTDRCAIIIFWYKFGTNNKHVSQDSN